MRIAVREDQIGQGAQETDRGKTCILILTCFKTRTTTVTVVKSAIAEL
jgi:hypothetical protein